MSLNMTSILRFGSEEQNILAFQIGCVKHSQDPRPAHIYITEKETDQTEFWHNKAEHLGFYNDLKI